MTSLTLGSQHPAIIQEVGDDHLWLLLGPAVRGKVMLLDASDDPAVLASFVDSFKAGAGVMCRVLAVGVCA